MSINMSKNVHLYVGHKTNLSCINSFIVWKVAWLLFSFGLLPCKMRTLRKHPPSSSHKGDGLYQHSAWHHSEHLYQLLSAPTHTVEAYINCHSSEEICSVSLLWHWGLALSANAISSDSIGFEILINVLSKLILEVFLPLNFLSYELYQIKTPLHSLLSPGRVKE